MADGAGPAFDAYLVVDWSAHQGPKQGADSIWWAFRRRAGQIQVANPPTRGQALAELTALLSGELARDRKVLVGFDFPYGYPAGTAAALGLAGPPWRALWAEWTRLVVDEQERGQGNRFEVAAELNRRFGAGLRFWGAPPARAGAWMPATRPPIEGRPRERRHVEERLPRAKTVWQLLGAGSVGSQTLMGLPCLQRLLTDPRLAPRSTVWPFESGFALPDMPGDDGWIVHAEVYPSLVEPAPRPGEPKDAGQVRALATHLAGLDSLGELGRLFTAPAGLGERATAEAASEEGWVLGVP